MDDEHAAGTQAAGLAETIGSLAAIPRLPTSDGERLAADLIRQRFEAAGCAVWLEEVPAYRSYAQPIGLLCAAGVASGGPGGSRPTLGRCTDRGCGRAGYRG
jgi:hypothetical protein